MIDECNRCRKRREKRERRIRSLEDNIADTEDDLHRWGWSYKPSKKRSIKESIERLQTELLNLTHVTLPPLEDDEIDENN